MHLSSFPRLLLSVCPQSMRGSSFKQVSTNKYMCCSFVPMRVTEKRIDLTPKRLKFSRTQLLFQERMLRIYTVPLYDYEVRLHGVLGPLANGRADDGRIFDFQVRDRGQGAGGRGLTFF